MTGPASIAVSVALYAAALVLVVGVAARCARYARKRPAHGLVLTPAPITRAGVVLRLLVEGLAFRSLFRADRTAWFLGWTLHATLAVVAIDHLWLFVDPVWAALWRLHALTVWVGAALLGALLGLWGRRLVVERVRYISAPSDHLHLALLGTIAATGLAMRTVAPTDLGAVRTFTLGLVGVEWRAFPADPVALAHVAGAVVLALVFPFSKLMHAPGLLFSPTLARAGRRPRGESRP